MPKISSRVLIKGVPYYSQWESSCLVGNIIRDDISAREDPKWKESGALSPKEYEFWARNLCGMACLKMILGHKYKQSKAFPLVKLGKKCLKYGGYVIRGDEIDGLYYKPFVEFIDKEFDLKACVAAPLSLDRIIQELSLGNYVIASVSHKIRSLNFAPLSKGGHLVLLLGYSLSKRAGSLYFHNPSGDTEKNQKYAKISFNQFDKFFAGRGIVIEKC